MKVSDTFYNIRCDACGTELCEEWYHDAGTSEFATILCESGWFTAEHDRHYCPDCWERDDDDRIKTRDGRTYEQDIRLVPMPFEPDKDSAYWKEKYRRLKDRMQELINDKEE